MRVNNVPNQYHHARAIDNYYINQNSVPRKLARHDSNTRSPARSPNQSPALSRINQPYTQRNKIQNETYYQKITNNQFQGIPTRVPTNNQYYRAQNTYSLDKSLSNKNSPNLEKLKLTDSNTLSDRQKCKQCSKKLTNIQLKISSMQSNITNLTIQLKKITDDHKPSSKQTDNSAKSSNSEQFVSLFHGSPQNTHLKLQLDNLKKEMNDIKIKSRGGDGEGIEAGKSIKLTIREAVNQLKANLYQEMLDLQTKINKLRKNDHNSIQQQINALKDQIINKKTSQSCLPSKFTIVQNKKIPQNCTKLLYQLQHKSQISLKNLNEPVNNINLQKFDQIYYVDNEGYLLDHDKKYLTTNDDKMIKFSIKHFEELKKQGIFK